jgi:hypothetical protein
LGVRRRCKGRVHPGAGKNLKARDYLNDLGVDVRIIL